MREKYYCGYEIRRAEECPRTNGVWISGRTNDWLYRFEALVVREPTQHRSEQINGTSRIVELMVMDAERIVYNWDRRLDVAPLTPDVADLVERLVESLAERARSADTTKP
jgi:hypothetical protein